MLKRLLQFLLIYTSALLVLWAAKYGAGLSDYLIPPPGELFNIATQKIVIYITALLNTTGVAATGHAAALLLAVIVGLAASRGTALGSIVRMAAFNLQAYPVVAVAPIIFLFLGDGFTSRILIAALICYFPMLLSFIGIFSQPVPEVEHFFRNTGRITWKLEIGIRCFENMDKLITVTAGSCTLAMVGAIVAEFLAATHGIGYIIRKALYQSSLAKILVCLFLIGMASSLYVSGVEILGRKLKRRLEGL